MSDSITLSKCKSCGGEIYTYQEYFTRLHDKCNNTPLTDTKVPEDQIGGTVEWLQGRPN